MSDYGKLVEALRSRSVLCETIDCDACEAIHFVCTDKILHDAAAAIEELQAEVKRLEPKRGEWKVDMSHFSPHIVCSVCGVEIPCVAGWCMDEHMNYCPNCGAKMEVQDGTD